MRDAARRIENYNARMQSTELDPVFAAKAEIQKANFAAYAEDFVPKQESLRIILNALGIPTIQFLAYEAYHGELYHISKTASGESAIAQATILVARYVAYGLTEATLIEIANTIYAIVVTPV